MKLYQIFYRSRIFTKNKFRLSSIFIFILLFIILIIRTYFYQNLYLFNPSIAYNQHSELLNKQKILLPVTIKKLYDYRVVCSHNNGTIDRKNLLKQLSKTCHINLNGSLKLNLNPPDDFQIRLSTSSKYLKLWQTNTSCSLYGNETIAIIISYRDRKKNLEDLLYNLIPFLQRQHIRKYKIFIIEQQTTGAFNKGRLYNIAFHHLMKTYKPTCVIFHGKLKRILFSETNIFFYLDADLIPENDQNLYSCLTLTEHPLHMSANVRFRVNGTYTTIYPFLVGGVLTIQPKTFSLLNGYSNEYFNWGGEDDDMGLRFLSKDICVQRPINGYYYAKSHTNQIRNKNRFRLLFDAVLRQDNDGLSNIEQLAVIDNVYEYPLVTWMTVKWIDHLSE